MKLLRKYLPFVLLGVGFSAWATVTQIDGTLVPKNNTLANTLNIAEGATSYAGNGQVEASFEPSTFTIVDDDANPNNAQVVPLQVLDKSASGDFTWGFYLLDDPRCKVVVFTCSSTAGSTANVDFNDSDDANAATRLSYVTGQGCADPDSDGAATKDRADSYQFTVDGPIGFFLVSPKGSGDSCGSLPATGDTNDDIFFTQRALNTDGDFVHTLVYTSKRFAERFYFGYESGLVSGSNKFIDMVIQAQGLTPPCIPSAEVCGNGVDDDCDGIIDDDFVGAGEPCGDTDGECSPGLAACIAGQPVCLGATGPFVETCNGLDDDCDGVIDNSPQDVGVGFTCGTDVGECTVGFLECSAGNKICNGIGPSAEICDNRDNDCNTFIDDNPIDVGPSFPCGTNTGECSQGFFECQGGFEVCNGVGPSAEFCDNLDNDCDGFVDEAAQVDIEDPSVGNLCGSNTGECNQGLTACSAGAVICQGEIGPSAERCDGLDNDCDATTDELADLTDINDLCGSNTGECSQGLTTCVPDPTDTNNDGLLGKIICQGGVGPTAESCDGKDNDCNGQIDNNATGVGQTCGVDTGECSTGLTSCQGGVLACVGGVNPANELCDNKDNDCDGTIDDSVSATDDLRLNRACGSNVGTCRQGATICGAGGTIQCSGAVGPGTERCDNLDNDCDGSTDEASDVNANEPTIGNSCGVDTGECNAGAIACIAGALQCAGGVGPVNELCDNKDNDCDGSNDNNLVDPRIGISCGSEIGACQAGVQVCTNGGPVCQGAIGPITETCNGLDDDCDGAADDNPTDVGISCGLTNTGECSLGLLQCQNGVRVCVGEIAPANEVCDGVDNDCDGIVDNNPTDIGGLCGGGPVNGGNSTCSQGTNQCQSGVLVCVGDVKPGAELCDNLDNDCNGVIDDSAVGNNAACGSSVGECNPGFINCQAGVQVCLNATVAKQELCNGLDDDCDGVIDNNPTDAGGLCGGGLVNGGSSTCSQGTNQCQAGALVCVGDVKPSTEQCDNLDNNCNGVIDDSAVGNGTPCGSDVGECSLGFLNCQAGVQVCLNDVGPQPELCNGLDDNCDGTIDDNPTNVGGLCGGGLVNGGSSTCSQGTNQCQSGALVCVGDVKPGAELCDNLDNDCNGVVDDSAVGNNAACGSSVGECNPGFINCQAGVQVCLNDVTPQPELCNGLDDDCDGVIDNTPIDEGGLCGGGLVNGGTSTCNQGTNQCQNGALICVGSVGPVVESCDNFDNDCDGAIDNAIPGALCGSDVGECSFGGTQCIAGQTICVGGVSPNNEICDAKDNDCNGVIDNDLTDIGLVCGTEEGECSSGLTVCDSTDADFDGVLLECFGELGPTLELCDGLDNDCDGAIDNNTSDTGGDCSDGNNSCGGGIFVCLDGAIVCQGEIEPAPEICNCLDDNCDTLIDTPLDIACPVGTACVDCACRQPCDLKTRCPGGQLCIDDFCRPDPCIGVSCGDNEVCVPSNGVGVCVNTCAGVTCGVGDVCVDGDCRPDNCFTFGCQDQGDLCLDGVCQPNPCDTTTCGGANEFCAIECQAGDCLGVCRATCVGVLCGVGQQCFDGECVVDRCDPPPTCNPGEICSPATGECIDNPCGGVTCGDGAVCDIATGNCISDPCTAVVCPGDPSEVSCELGQCVSTTQIKVLTSGGCAVEAPDSQSRGPLTFVLSLFGLLLLRRRSNRSTALILGVVVLAVASGCKLDPVGLDRDGNVGPLCIKTQNGIEICDGLDNDCDTETDENLANCSTCTTNCSQCIISNGGIELCDTIDNDCDGSIDETFDLTSDDANCGVCHKDCNTVFPGGFGDCQQSVCVFESCAAGFFDEDGDPANGCEYSCQLSGAEVCDNRDNDCDGFVDRSDVDNNGTFEIDFDFANDINNCGSCNHVCAFSNAVEACVQGQCVITQCNANFEDRDGDINNGCESFCAPSNGGVEICDAKDNDCDGFNDASDLNNNGVIDGNDISFDLNNDPNNCGACNRTCSFPEASALCSQGTCNIGACNAGFIDLDGLDANGCEYQCTNTNGSIEICDGLDNDCNGFIDDFPTDIGGSCATLGTTGIGECNFGIEVCSAGAVVCVGEGTPTPELCDALDNDCNALTDDNVINDERACGSNIGECQLGLTFCDSADVDADGVRLECSVDNPIAPPGLPGVGPKAELCDNRDNDCDGTIDNSPTDATLGNACGDGTGECSTGTLICQGGAILCAGQTGPATEVCDGLDNDCDGQTDESLGAAQGVGLACGSNIGECELGATFCDSADADGDGVRLECSSANPIAPPGSPGVGPKAELCDNRDNDCDGTIDNSPTDATLGNACGDGTGECSTGTLICQGGAILCAGQTGPATEVCDGLDNDCDGQTDEGLGTAQGVGLACGSNIGECRLGTSQCINGAIACPNDVEPSAELCDNKDNDCDGVLDDNLNDPQVGVACGSDVGECATGTLACNAGSLFCTNEIKPTLELCDNKDNDCDGTVDDAPADIGQTCGSNVGECQTGTFVCLAGGIRDCQGDIVATPEVCDTKDNDCDGVADEQPTDAGGSCGTSNIGACSLGTLICADGNLTCTGNIEPRSEVCDGIDNDCDGTTDDSALGSGFPCGTDTGECSAGTTACVGAQIICQGEVGPTSESCDAKDNDCDGATDDNPSGTGGSCGGGPVNGGTSACRVGALLCAQGSIQCIGGVTPSTEICDGIDNDCDGVVDNNVAQVGTSCGGGLGQCTPGTLQCQAGNLICTGVGQPSTEVCDNKDNDCDGFTDEGATGGNLGQSCGATNVGECEFGVVACTNGAETCVGSVTAQAEICDGKDNDCNGVIDNSLTADPRINKICGTNLGECFTGLTGCVQDPTDTNNNGKLAEIDCLGEQGPQPESCNGLDEDCDGVEDNNLSTAVDPDLGDPCGGGTVNTGASICRIGAQQCVLGSIKCVGNIDPQTEFCNGADDDCDGTTDDNPSDPQLGQSCGTDDGVCTAGVNQCISGAVDCVGDVGPTSGEVCNGLDDDCDGATDALDASMAAAPSGFCPAQVGVCVGVVASCRNGAFECNTPVTFETTESSCDGLDNDCDGTVDEGCLVAKTEAINTDPNLGNHSFRPSVAADGANVYIAFSDTASGSDIFFKRSTDRGASFGTELTVSNANKRSANSNVYVQQAGAVAVLFEEFPGSDDSRDVMFNRSTNAGVSFLASPVRIDRAGSAPAATVFPGGANVDGAGTGANADTFFLEAAVNGTNRVYIVWADTRFGSTTRNVYLRASTNGGSTFGPEIKVNNSSSATAFASEPHITIGSDGRAIVVFTDASATGEPDLFVVTVTNPQTTTPTISAPTRIDSGATGDILQKPVIAADPSGHVVVAWQDLRDANSIDVRYAQNNNNGTGSWTLESDPLDETGLLQDGLDIQIAANANRFFLSWEDHRAGLPEQIVAVSTDGGLFFNDQCRIGTASGLCKVSRISIINGTTIKAGATSQPRLAINSQNVIFASFINNRFGKRDVFMNFSLDNGATWQNFDVRLDVGNTAGLSDSFNPDLAASFAAGKSFGFTVWEDQRQDGNLSNIFGNRVEN